MNAYEAEARLPWLERIPVRRGDLVTLLPVKQIASIVAERELLHITTVRNEKHTITYRLKDLEARLPPSKFVRLGRGTMVAIEMITSVQLMPGSGYLVSMSNGDELQVSRIQSRVVRNGCSSCAGFSGREVVPSTCTTSTRGVPDCTASPPAVSVILSERTGVPHPARKDHEGESPDDRPEKEVMVVVLSSWVVALVIVAGLSGVHCSPGQERMVPDGREPGLASHRTAYVR